MKRHASALALAVGLVSITAAQVEGQLWFFPDYAVPSSNGTPSTFVAGTFGRGVNEDSGELNAFGAVVGRTGERVSVMGGIGMVDDVDSEITLGGSVGVDVVNGESATISVQGGIGWMSPGDFTLVRVPIGLAIKGNGGSGSTSVIPWIMPRLNYTRVSFGGASSSETDFGASGGVGITSQGGFGVHLALDALFANETIFTLGLGVHYVVGRSGN